MGDVVSEGFEQTFDERGLRFYKWHLDSYRGLCISYGGRNLLTIQHGPVFGAWTLFIGRWSHDSRRIRRWIETGV